MVAAFLAGGVAGTLLGGPLGDYMGRKPLLMFSLLAVLPLQVALMYAHAGWLTVTLLALTGLMVTLSFTITLVMSQEFMPRYLAVASGLNVGFSIGMGGVGAALLGTMADIWGIPRTLQAIMVLPFLGIVTTFLLPSSAAPTG